MCSEYDGWYLLVLDETGTQGKLRSTLLPHSLINLGTILTSWLPKMQALASAEDRRDIML